ncbi:MAG: ribosomal RNA small subunit methyltransferase A [Elusimicrobia bacterium]|nr:ribosomal RNA small subunit methyltransferase A [Elusimicrobiota bacterium]
MGARLDQHFLADPAAADAIVRAAAVRPGEAVLEIGPGRGVLTERLLAAGAAVTAVEIDERLAAALPLRLKHPGLTVVRADFLRLDTALLPPVRLVVSNLPYSVGTPITLKLLDWPVWSEAVLMFQKEVAERLTAQAGGRDYGPLTLAVALRAEAHPLFSVGRESFRPPPKVDSGVVLLRRPARLRLPPGLSERAFERVVKADFSQRRKMAAKCLAGALGLARPEVDKVFVDCGVPASARAEAIPFESFVALARRLRTEVQC